MRTRKAKVTATPAMITAIVLKAGSYPICPIKMPAMIGPAASPISQIVPNTPMPVPRRRAVTRSAISALVAGVTAAMEAGEARDAENEGQSGRGRQQPEHDYRLAPELVG